MGDQAPTKTELTGMKTFIGCKVIKGVAMDLDSYNKQSNNQMVNPQSENAPGYMVQYPDGYTSWSPKHVFEEAYREINTSELKMCQ